MDDQVYHQLKDFLRGCKKGKPIDLDTLQRQMSGDILYEQFAKAVKRLESEGVLKPYKGDTNKKSIELALRFHFIKQFLLSDTQELIKDAQLKLKSVSLENYFHLPFEQFQKDQDYFRRIDEYINLEGLPTEPMPLPVLSFLLVNDEKWLQEKGGITLLKRIKLWELLKIPDTLEPVAFAINPCRLVEEKQYHLIIENKSPYLQMIEGLQGSAFTSLVFGAGWKVVSGIKMLKKQLGTGTGVKDVFYYFGDLDHEGIHIWYRTNALVEVKLAIPFYQSLFSNAPAEGKSNQRIHRPSLKEFISCFSKEDHQILTKTLSEGCYYPQEALGQKRLIEIMQTVDFQ